MSASMQLLASVSSWKPFGQYEWEKKYECVHDSILVAEAKGSTVELTMLLKYEA